MKPKIRIFSSSFTVLFILILLFVFPAAGLPQEINITSFLKQIEAGQKETVIRTIPGLKQQYPNSPSLIYLEALLTEDGEIAVKLYQSLVEKHPNSKYADDAMYRIYAYFNLIDEPNKAGFFLKRLKAEYPESPYLKLAERVTFSEISNAKITSKEPKTYPKLKEKVVNKNYKFTVQAGAFTRKDNALKLKADFDKAGYSSQVEEKSVAGSLFHVVYVGKFTSDEEARGFLNIINSKFNLQGWVVKLD